MYTGVVYKLCVLDARSIGTFNRGPYSMHAQDAHACTGWTNTRPKLAQTAARVLLHLRRRRRDTLASAPPRSPVFRVLRRQWTDVKKSGARWRNAALTLADAAPPSQVRSQPSSQSSTVGRAGCSAPADQPPRSARGLPPERLSCTYTAAAAAAAPGVYTAGRCRQGEPERRGASFACALYVHP